MKKPFRYVEPCRQPMARYHGAATATKTTAAATRSAARSREARRSMATIGATTRPGITHGQRALGEEAERGGRRRQQQPLARPGHAVADRDERRGNGRRDEEGQRQVGQGHAAQRDVAEAGGDDRAGDQRRVVVVPAARQAGGDEDQADAGQRRPQPGRARARAGDREGRRREPVIEDRLLEARLVVEGRGQPVARLDHLARGLGVERFVGIGDRRRAEPDQEGQAGERPATERANAARGNCSGTAAASRGAHAYTRRMATIKVRQNGSLLVEGDDVTLVDWNGNEYTCRSGRSRCAGAGARRASRSATAPTTASASPPANARCRRRPRATRRRLRVRR